jgi:KUP system potassium uptake protein
MSAAADVATQQVGAHMATSIPGFARSMAEGDAPLQSKSGFWALTIGSLGVVYGDIGTSPLYAFREAAKAAGNGEQPAAAAILGVLSLIFWTLTLVVTLKYVLILTRADNHGEGGTLALMALALRAIGRPGAVVLLGIVAAALFYGDAVITPALSVLSAVEGLEVVAPSLAVYVLPLSVAILVVLFLVQWRGTATVSAVFGPVMTAWFLVIALLGLVHIAANPGVLAAINPAYAVAFLAGHGMISLLTLGAVFLCVTGAEALYADMGHFGRRPIQVAWLVLAFPALVLNYFGQGAMVLADGATLDNPFFVMAPRWAQLPMVLLATLATVIASQAVITGAYSLTRQAIQLGLLPRLEIRHTSEKRAGQIYMPRVNTLLLILVLLLVGLFRSSGALASAYGIAVSGTMVITAVIAFVVVRRVWRWHVLAAAALIVPFLLIDLSFFGANLLKFVDGGWFPLLLGALLMLVMLTWRQGSRVLFDKTRRLEIPLRTLVDNLEKNPPPRKKGTAIFLTGDPEGAPTALLHSLKHFGTLHDHNVIMTVVTDDAPSVPPDSRVTYEQLSPSFARLTVRYGFSETPNIAGALAAARQLGWTFDIMSTSFVLSRRSVKTSARRGLRRWRDTVFTFLTRNADDASRYFRLPADRVIEIGMQVSM